MKTLVLFITIISLIMPGTGFILQAQSETIGIGLAQEIAANAGGTYISGATAPVVTGTQVALPVIGEGTSAVLGHIVAEKAALVTTLNAAGYAEVATALAATQAGTVAGVAAGTGLALGTTGTVALVAAGVGGIALAVSSGDDSTTTTHHH